MIDITSELSRIEREIAGKMHYRDILNEISALDFPEIGQLYAYDNDIVVHLPYNLELYKKSRKLVESVGFKYASEYTSPENGVLSVYFIREAGGKPKEFLDITLWPQQPGATCKLNLIGYEQKPIYEVTCLDAEPLIEAQP